jgi:hypothetical protein
MRRLAAPPAARGARAAAATAALLTAAAALATGCRPDASSDDPPAYAGGAAQATLADSAAVAERRRDVAERGARVMPFDLDRTTHVFSPNPSGGIQTVTADDPADGEQVRLTRVHLREEAERFRRGDFADPAAIHGAAMPGLAELRAGAARIEVTYTDVPGGGAIRYETRDPALVRALHAWFAAQRFDHGAHAAQG